MFIILRPRQSVHHFADDIFECIFLNENVWISLKISLKFVPKVPINNIPPLVHRMAWCRAGDKPVSESMTVSLLAHICATRPQWVLYRMQLKRADISVCGTCHSALLTFKRVGRIPLLEHRPQLCQEFHVHYSGDLLWGSPAPCLLISHHDVCRCLSIKMSSYQYRDSHVKDKTVSPTVLSLTWESPCLGKTVFILRRGPGRHQQPCW